MDYRAMNAEQRKVELDRLMAEYGEIKAKGLQLNLARGNPSKLQLDLSMGLLDILNSGAELISESGDDCRTYGVLGGVPEAKKLMGDVLGVAPSKVMVFGNSSLLIMYYLLDYGMLKGVGNCPPMAAQGKCKWLCPAPGYDRHFKMAENLGFELITIPMKADGPDMELVREYAENDPSVKGIWCVPKYSNPTGVVYSDEVCEQMAALKPAAEDFRIYWDNAYCVHPLYPDQEEQLPDILELCEKAGNPDMVYEFCSTSKITCPGAGIAALATSEKNQKELRERYFQFIMIGPDKLNQLRHVRYFGTVENLRAHMRRHADLIRPKFELINEFLTREFEGTGLVEWLMPKGGYFISLETLPGCAKRTIALAKEAGVTFTSAGATYPYGVDPQDSNIRLAPTFAPIEQISPTMEVLCICIKIASLESMEG